MTVECETVTVVIPEANARLTIPAYTRELADMVETVSRHLAEYTHGSGIERESMSVGDFALWLIRKASEEPLFIEEKAE